MFIWYLIYFIFIFKIIIMPTIKKEYQVSEEQMVENISWTQFENLVLGIGIELPDNKSFYNVFLWLSRYTFLDPSLTYLWEDEWTYNALGLEEPIHVFAQSPEGALYTIAGEAVKRWYLPGLYHHVQKIIK